MIAAIKLATIALWLVVLANVVMPFGGQVEGILNWVGIAVLAAHALEAFLYLPIMKKIGGSMPRHIIQVLIFGLGHFLIMQETLKSQEA